MRRCHQHPSTHSFSSFPGSLSQQPHRAGCGPKRLNGPKGCPECKAKLGLIGAQERGAGCSTEKGETKGASPRSTFSFSVLLGSFVCSHLEPGRGCPLQRGGISKTLGREGVPEMALNPGCASPTHMGLSVSVRCWFSF